MLNHGALTTVLELQKFYRKLILCPPQKLAERQQSKLLFSRINLYFGTSD